MAQQEEIEIKKKEPLAPEIGHAARAGSSGTELFSGYFNTDYLKRFGPLTWAQTADKMHRSDEKVAEILLVTRRPIESAQWVIEDADDEPESKEIADYIRAVFWDNFPLEKFLNDATTFVKYGYVTFETVFKMQDVKKYGLNPVVEGVYFMRQDTIERFEFDSETKKLKSVHQQAHGDLASDAEVPAENLIILTLNGEGDDLLGIPPLRSSYRFWLLKDETLKTLRRGNINAALAVPFIKMPPGRENDTTSTNVIDQMLNDYALGLVQGFRVPAASEVGSLTMKWDADKIIDCCRYFDAGMARAIGAAFTEIGSSGKSGGFAQSRSEMDLYLSGLEAVANMIASGLTLGVVKPLVEWRYGPGTKLPRVRAKGLNDTDSEVRMNAIKTAKDAGLISVSPEVGEQIHQELKLPDYNPDYAPLSPKEQAAQAIERAREAVIKGTPDLAGGGARGGKAPPKPANDSKGGKEPAKARAMEEHDCDAHERRLSEEGDHPAIRLIDERAADLANALAIVIEDRGGLYVKAVLSAYKAGKPLDVIGQTEIPSRAPTKRFLRDQMTTTARLAMRQAFEEVGAGGLTVKLDDEGDVLLPPAIREEIALAADVMLDAQEARLKQDVMLRLSALASRNPTDTAVASSLNLTVKAIATSPGNETAGVSYSSSVVNSSRQTVFRDKAVMPRIAMFRFENPAPVSAICRNLNGKVFSKEEFLNSSYLPPLHINCKSVIIPFMVDAENLPSITTGLTPTGTEDEVAKAIKSIGFK